MLQPFACTVPEALAILATSSRHVPARSSEEWSRVAALASTAGPQPVSEALCTVTLSLDDRMYSTTMRDAARNLLWTRDSGRVWVRVFDVRVPLLLSADVAYQDPDRIHAMALEQLCQSGVSALAFALQHAMYQQPLHSCVLLPDGFARAHAASQTQWLQDAITHVRVDQFMPFADSLASIALWNATRVKWSARDAVWRLRPGSYDECLWANPCGLQRFESGFVLDTTLRFQAARLTMHTLRPALDPLARVVDMLERVLFHTNANGTSFAMCLLSRESLAAFFGEVKERVTDAEWLHSVGVECAAAESDELVKSLDHWHRRASVHGAIPPWLRTVRFDLQREACVCIAGAIRERMDTSAGFEFHDASNGRGSARALARRVRLVLAMWMRIVLQIEDGLDQYETRVEAAAATLARRLFRIESGLNLDGVDGAVDVADMCDRKRVEAAWRDIACRVYTRSVPKDAITWLDTDLDADDSAAHVFDTETERVLDVWTNRFVDIAQQHNFVPTYVSAALVLECSTLAPTLAVRSRSLLFRTVVLHLATPDVLSRLLAAVVLRAQAPTLEARVCGLLAGQWPCGGFSAANNIAAHTTLTCRSVLANSLAQLLLLESLTEAELLVERVRDQVADSNDAAVRNTCSVLGAGAIADENEWQHWAGVHATREPAWLFRHSWCATTTSADDKHVIVIARDDNDDDAKQSGECGIGVYRCAVCLCLCYTRCHENVLGYLYCGGARCLWYGSLSREAQRLVHACFGDKRAQDILYLRVAGHPATDDALRAWEAFTTLRHGCEPDTYKAALIESGSWAWQSDAKVTDCQTGFLNPLTTCVSFVAPGALLQGSEREPVLEYSVLALEDFTRRQRAALSALIHAEAGVCRTHQQQRAMFDTLGVVEPTVPSATDASSAGRRLQDHRWWHRIHATPRTQCVAGSAWLVAERAPYVQLSTVAVEHDDVGPATTQQAAASSIMTPAVLARVAEAYAAHLGVPWLTQCRLLGVEHDSVPRLHLSDVPVPNQYDFDYDCAFTSSGSLLVWAATSRSTEHRDADVHDAGVDSPVPLIGSSRSATVPDEAAEEWVETDSDFVLSDHKSLPSPRSPPTPASPSRVSTAGTYDDYGDSDLYWSEDSYHMAAAANAAAAAVAAPSAKNIPIRARVNKADALDNERSALEVEEPESDLVVELLAGVTDVDFRARQLTQRLQRGYHL